MPKSTLQSKVQALALEFATGVAEGFTSRLMEIVISSPINEIASLSDKTEYLEDAGGARRFLPVKTKPGPKPKAGKKGRLARRSEEDIAEVVARIVKFVTSKPKGVRAEEIRDGLGLEPKEMKRPVDEALASKQISKTGNKRATTYFAGKKAGKTAAAKVKPAKKAVKKAAKKTKPAKVAKTVSVKAGVVKTKAKKKTPKKNATAKPVEAAAADGAT